MQHKILLLDELGERWGESHTFYDLRTPADAIRLLCINYPDFGKYLATSHEQGIAYQVTQVGHELKANELTLPLGQHDLVIAPVIIGSEGAVKAIAGAALIATAVITGGAGGFLATFQAGGLTGAAATIGASLVLSGVQEMLAPQPTTYDSSFDVVGNTDGITYYYEHETGINQIRSGVTTAIPASITSGDFDITQKVVRGAATNLGDLRGDGENIMRVSRILPDFISQTGDAIVQLDLRNYPNDASVSSSLGPFTVSGSTDKVDTRARARAVALKISNTAVDTAWKLGTFRLDIHAGGRR